MRRHRTNEELFFDYYPRLLEWATQLTHLDRADAEDLVQDLYIQVMSINVVVDEVDEIEPYLFKILRNLHYSRLRRKGRSPIYDLSIVDYDSVERGLAAVDRRALFLVHANLRLICEFVCQRKDTARSASIFLLRFFLGYYPSEVMKVVLGTRASVDRSLQLVRREAQSYLDQPSSTSPAVQQNRRSAFPASVGDDSHALFLELRQTIFSSCKGPCFDGAVLEQHYRDQSPARFTVPELAHLVSCKTCLDRANTILGLPLLDERSPDDTLGRDNLGGSGSSDSPKSTAAPRTKGPASAKERSALDRKVREFFEHRPASLEIGINGEIRSSQRVTAQISEFHLKLNRTEDVNFIEVFSEQGIRLAYMQVTEPTLNPGLEQRHRVALSDGRSLVLTLSFAADLPTVHAVYTDPVFVETATDEDATELDVSGTAAEKSETPAKEDLPQPGSVIKFPIRRWAAFMKSRFAQIALPHMNPLFASALTLTFASAICFFIWLRSAPGINAGIFLNRAQAQEASVDVNAQPGVIFQKIRIKTPVQTSERTIYRDIQRRRRVREHALEATEAELRERLSVAGVDWNDPLSPTAYRDWHNRETVETDSVKRTGRDLLTVTTSVSGGEVVSESLTVRESDFHAIGKTIQFRNYGTVEIAELNYDVLPWNAVSPDWFEPLAATGPGVISDVHPSLLPRFPSRLSEVELDQAELEARLVLNQLHADTSERLEIVRGGNGIEVKGIVETAMRKQEIEKELRRVPHVVPALYTFQEAASQPLAGTEVTSIKQTSIEAEPSPLEKYLLERGESHAQISQVYQELFTSSVAVNQNSKAIAELLPRYASGERLTDTAQAALEQLLTRNRSNLATALQQEVAIVKQLESGAVRSPGNGALNPSLNVLTNAAARNVSLCNELITSSTSSPRRAEAISADLAQSIAQMTDIINRIPDQSQFRHMQESSRSSSSKQ
jgi:DNA-directed RNA polymerase specialized sigma24 family protein